MKFESNINGVIEKSNWGYSNSAPAELSEGGYKDIRGGYSYDEKDEDVPEEVIVAKKKRNSQRCFTILKVPRMKRGKLIRTQKCDTAKVWKRCPLSQGVQGASAVCTLDKLFYKRIKYFSSQCFKLQCDK